MDDKTSIAVVAPRLLKVGDVAQRCQCGRNTAYELVHRAGAIRFGRSLRVRAADLERLLDGMAGAGRA